MKDKKEVELRMEQILINSAIADVGLCIPRDMFNSVIYDIVNMLSSDGNLRFSYGEDDIYTSNVLCSILTKLIQKDKNCSDIEVKMKKDCSVYIGNIGIPYSCSLYCKASSLLELNNLLFNEILYKINLLTK